MKRKQSGQGLVEFALIAMVLLLLIVVGIESINLIIQWQSLHQAAQWSVREAAKDGGASDRVQTELQVQMRARGIDPSAVTVNIFAVDIAPDGSVTPVIPVTEFCQYGGNIAVELRQPWQTTLLSAVAGEGEFVALHTFECWRGRLP